MYKQLPAICLSLGLATLAFGQTTLVEWTFENSIPTLGDSATITGISAETGSGSASGVHASANTDWSNPAGDGTAESFASNNWASGDYFEFSTTLNTSLYDSLVISWSQSGSNTGPKDFTFSYDIGSTGIFIGTETYAVSSSSSWTDLQYTIDLSSVTGSSLIQVRLTNTSGVAINLGSVGTSGSSKVDTFNISGNLSAVPEPSTYAAFAGVAMLGFAAYRRRQRKGVATAA